jgi:uncharacterized membrane protein
MVNKAESKKQIGGCIENQTLVPSSIAKVQVLSTNTSLAPNRRFKVEMRDKESQKVSLALYREESKKIFEILRRYSDLVEKASCDEAFLDLTK